MAKKQTVTTAQAAEMTGLSVRRITDMCNDGRLAATKDRAWSIEKSSVTALVREMAKKAKEKTKRDAQKAKKAAKKPAPKKSPAPKKQPKKPVKKAKKGGRK